MLMLLLLAGAHILMLMMFLLFAVAHILMLMMFLLQSVNIIAAVLDIDLMKIQMYKEYSITKI